MLHLGPRANFKARPRVLLAISAISLCALLMAGGRASAVDWVDWPQGGMTNPSGQDPIAAIRWNTATAWTVTQPASVEPLLRDISARLRATPESAVLLAYRAV